MTKEEYHFWQDNGICPKCHKNKLMGNEKTCPECRAYFASYQAKRRSDPNKIEHINEMNRIHTNNMHKRRKENGLCITCGRKVIDGKTKCYLCREKANKRNRQKYQKSTKRQQWVANGLCFLCGQECCKGLKVCEKHREVLKNNFNMRTKK